LFPVAPGVVPPVGVALSWAAALVDMLRGGIGVRPELVGAGAEALVTPAGVGAGAGVAVPADLVGVVVGCSVFAGCPVVAGWAVVVGVTGAGFAGGLAGGFAAGFFTGGRGNAGVCPNAAGLNRTRARKRKGAKASRSESERERMCVQSLLLFQWPAGKNILM
jgi:hypothetical protein